mgnify:CR=1 FL=1
MKRSLKELSGYKVQAIDQQDGKVIDFLFDDESWVVRYVEIDFGNFFINERVIIPGVFFDKIDYKEKLFNINLKLETIKNGPKPETKMPVSRKYEEALNKYYAQNPYWPVSTYYPPAHPKEYYPPRPLKVPAKIISENINTNLRSFQEVNGYIIQAIDDKIGHIEDIIIDDADRQIVYLVIDTSNWMPWSKKVLIAVEWLSEISYLDQEAQINLLSKTIKEAPEFNYDSPIQTEYEIQLYNFYNDVFKNKL